MREAIDSALAQTYPNIEIIVVNDGSNDNGATEKIALGYGEKITYIKKENGGVSSALNAGIEAMRGEYFSWLSHDDKYLPEKIETQVAVLIQYQDDDIIALCGSKQINDKSEDLAPAKTNYATESKVIDWRGALKDVIQSGSYNGCALLIPRAAFTKCGRFDESLRYSQDFLMWIKLFLGEYKLVHMPGIHVCNRVHDRQLTQTGRTVFYHDCRVIGDMLLGELSEKSTKEYNFLKSFAIYNAKYNVSDVAEAYIMRGKKESLLSVRDVLQIRAVEAYGRVRPTIRKTYYKLFKHVKTQS